MEKLPPYAPVRCRTATVRVRKVVGGVIGVCSSLHLLAQLQLAAENDHFYDCVCALVGDPSSAIVRNQLCMLICISK